MASAFRGVVQALSKALKPPDFSRSSPFALFTFRNAEDLKKWVCTSDKDAFGGHSNASVEIMPEGYVRFKGNLSTKLPANTNVIRSGFCLFRSKAAEPKLFGREHLDLGTHNAIEFEVRGDGRAYIANLQPDTYRDEDLHQATIYTRGGPHWQTVQIPLDEFLLTHRGYVQNEQASINRDRIKTVGILLADRRDGPFQLDIREIRAVTVADTTETRMDRTRARMKTEWKAHQQRSASSDGRNEDGSRASASGEGGEPAQDRHQEQKASQQEDGSNATKHRQ